MPGEHFSLSKPTQ